jgi:hypothetical protein
MDPLALLQAAVPPTWQLRDLGGGRPSGGDRGARCATRYSGATQAIGMRDQRQPEQVQRCFARGRLRALCTVLVLTGKAEHRM